MNTRTGLAPRTLPVHLMRSTVADGNKKICSKFYLYYLCESKTFIDLHKSLNLYFWHVLPISVHLSTAMIFVIIPSSTFHLLLHQIKS